MLYDEKFHGKYALIHLSGLKEGAQVRFNYRKNKNNLSQVVGFIDEIEKDSIYVGNERDLYNSGVVSPKRYKLNKIEGIEMLLGS